MASPHTSISLMSASFLSPFFPAISKISGDQAAEIENEKDRMKERRRKRRKEGSGGKLENTFSRMQIMGIFSALWKGPIRLSSQPHGCALGALSFSPWFAACQTQSTIWK